jgi:glycosyltransferase involved in cell wall biosynthesis
MMPGTHAGDHDGVAGRRHEARIGSGAACRATRRRILYVEGCRDGTVGGSHISLYGVVANLDRARYQPCVVFYDDHAIAARMRSIAAEVHVLPNRRPFQVGRWLRGRSPWSRGCATALEPVQKAVNLLRMFLWPAVTGAVFLRRHAIDLVHLNNSISGNHEWMLASLLARVPFVSHERGVSARLSRSARILGGGASAVVCISRSIRELLVGQGVNAASAIVVYNGIDPTTVRPAEEPQHLRSRLGIGQDVPVIGVVGNLKQWKGQDTVVRATAMLKERWPRIRCLLVGSTGVDSGFDAHLRALVEQLGLAENVMFTGFQENPADFINVMDVVVHSSIEPEPFGRVNIEAMFLGKPVVSTNIGGPIEIFENGEDGILVEPGDATVLAKQVALLLESPGLREQLGENARATVQRRFTIAETVRAIQDLYARVLGERDVRTR